MRRFLLLLFSIQACLFAQEQTGVLDGRVTDSSGAYIGDVKVTVSSQAILGGFRSAQTGASGDYRFTELPIGDYDVKFEHVGFTTELHKGVQIQAATTFTVNGSLSISSVQQQVEVVGDAPMVDTAQTDVSFTFNRQIMDKIPNARDPWAMLGQVPGITTDTINVGGTQTGNQPTFRGHGVDPTQNTYMLNGANVTDNTDNGGSQFYFDVDSFGEMQVEVNSHGADVQTPGIVLNIVPKSGTNQFHGDASYYNSGAWSEFSNLDNNLRSLGVTNGSNLHKYYDYGFDVGGPIIKDRLWFWGSYRYQDVERLVTGTRNADGTYPIDKTHLWYPSGKINWQANSKNNVSFYFDLAQKRHDSVGLSALRPEVTTWNQQGDPIARLFTIRDDYVVSPKLVLSFKANIMDQGFEYTPQTGANANGHPTTLDLATGLYSYGPPYLYGISKNLRSGGVSGSYFIDSFLGASHALKFGWDLNYYNVYGNQQGKSVETFPENLLLETFNGAPSQVVFYSPGAESVTAPTQDIYIQDSWKYRRFTFDLGLRWDLQSNRLNAVTAPSTQYYPAVQQPGTGNLIRWNTFAPRIGVIYDVTGKSKSLLKASYNRYYWQLWTNLGAEASTAGGRTYTYKWTDTNSNGLYDSGETGALLSAIDPSRNPITVNPNLKATHTDEATASFSQEIIPNLAVNASYIFRKDSNVAWFINPNISPSDYTATPAADPFGGSNLLFYDLNSSKVSLSPNYVTTRNGYNQEYSGFEIEVVRRFSRGFQLVGSYTHGAERYFFGPGSYQNPQDIGWESGRRIPYSRPNIAKLIGSYQLPHNVMASVSYQGESGLNYTRTVNSQSALGYSLNQGNVAILSGPQDEQSYGFLNVLDARLSYDLKIKERATTTFVLDTFNLLNINTVDSIQTLSGSAYGKVLDFTPPRIFRVGVKFSF